MKISGPLDLAGFENVADRTAIPANECFEGRAVKQAGTIYVYTSGVWEPLAAGADSLPPITAPDAGKILKTVDGVSASWEQQYPTQTAQTGKFLQTDGSAVSWQDPPATIPAQTGNSGKVLTTNGTAVSWTDAMPRASLAAGTAAHVLINDGSGEASSEAQLAQSRGGFGANVSALTGYVKAASGTFSAAPIAAADLPTGIDAAKIGSGNVTTAEFEYIANLTSDAQTQLTARLPLAGGTMTGALTLAADPAAALQPATKQYVDNLLSGLKVKASVLTLADSNITLSGLQTINGVALIATDRVLLTSQTAPAQNGVYSVAAGAWTRVTDMNTWVNLVSAFVFVEDGSYADTGWVCTVNAGGTIGVTAVTWQQFSGAGAYTAGNGLQVSGTTFSVKLDGTTIAVSGSGTKIADSAPLVSPTVSQYITFSAIATPSAPGAGVRVYAKADGKLYKRAVGGIEEIVGGGLVTELKSTTFTAVAGYHYLCSTFSGAFTATLPAGAAGAVIRFSDDRRTWATANLTIAPASGESIGSLAANETLVCDLSGAFVQLAWDGTRWVIDTNGYAANVNGGIAVASGSTPGLYQAGAAPGYTGGAITTPGLVGEVLGTISAGTGGAIYQTNTTTALTTTPTDMVSITLNKGTYVVSGFTKLTGPGAGAVNVTFNFRIGGTTVGSTWVNQAVAASSECLLTHPTFPVVITTDGTAVAYRGSVNAGPTTNTTNNLYAVRIA